jgi:hypothetical protein
MGARGRELSASVLLAEDCADMKAVYEWLLGIGPKPKTCDFYSVQAAQET